MFWDRPFQDEIGRLPSNGIPDAIFQKKDLLIIWMESKKKCIFPGFLHDSSVVSQFDMNQLKIVPKKVFD